MWCASVLMCLAGFLAFDGAESAAKIDNQPPATQTTTLEAAIATQKTAEAALDAARTSRAEPLRIAELDVAMRKARLARAKVEVEASKSITAEAQRRYEREKNLSAPGSIDSRIAALTFERNQVELAIKELELRGAGLELAQAELMLERSKR